MSSTISYQNEQRNKPIGLNALKSQEIHFLSDLNEVMFEESSDKKDWMSTKERENDTKVNNKKLCIEAIYNSYFDWCYNNQTERESNQRNEDLLKSEMTNKIFSQLLQMTEQAQQSQVSLSKMKLPRGVNLSVDKWKIDKQVFLKIGWLVSIDDIFHCHFTRSQFISVLKYLALIQNGFTQIQCSNIDLRSTLIWLPAVPVHGSFVKGLEQVLLGNVVENNRNDSRLDEEEIVSIGEGFSDQSSNAKGMYVTEALSPQLTNRTQEGPDLYSAHLGYARSCEENSEVASTQLSTVQNTHTKKKAKEKKEEKELTGKLHRRHEKKKESNNKSPKKKQQQQQQRMSNSSNNVMSQYREQLESKSKFEEMIRLDTQQYPDDNALVVLQMLFDFLVTKYGDVLHGIVPQNIVIEIMVSSQLDQQTLEFIWNETKEDFELDLKINIDIRKKVKHENTPFQNGLNEKEFVLCLQLISLAQQHLPFRLSFLFEFVKTNQMHIHLPNVLVESEFLQHYEREDVSPVLQIFRHKVCPKMSCYNALLQLLGCCSQTNSPSLTLHKSLVLNVNHCEQIEEETKHEHEDSQHSQKMKRFLEILDETVGIKSIENENENENEMNKCCRRPSSITVHSRRKHSHGIQPVSIFQSHKPRINNCNQQKNQEQEQEQEQEQGYISPNGIIVNKESYKISGNAIDTYLKYFYSLQSSDIGCIPQQKAHSFFQRSGLSLAILSSILLMCKQNDTHWNDVRFCLAMHLINFARQGILIPETSVPKLFKSLTRRIERRRRNKNKAISPQNMIGVEESENENKKEKERKKHCCDNATFVAVENKKMEMKSKKKEEREEVIIMSSISSLKNKEKKNTSVCETQARQAKGTIRRFDDYSSTGGQTQIQFIDKHNRKVSQHRVHVDNSTECAYAQTFTARSQKPKPTQTKKRSSFEENEQKADFMDHQMDPLQTNGSSSRLGMNGKTVSLPLQANVTAVHNPKRINCNAFREGTYPDVALGNCGIAKKSVSSSNNGGHCGTTTAPFKKYFAF